MKTYAALSIIRLLVCVLFLCLLFSLSLTVAAQSPSNPPASVIVTSKFGGQIFGFDIDQNGTEGVLSESQTLNNGNFLSAVETFDQNTGKILNVLIKTTTMDDFLTLGIVGKSVGLVEREHEISFLNIQRSFLTINPMSGNKFTGKWTPPVGQKHLITQVSRNQGTTNSAVFAEDNSGNFIPFIFSSNVAANTFGPVIRIPDSTNFGSTPPPIALNTRTNKAYLGGGNGCFGCIPVIGVADLTRGTFTEFNGVGFGFINGIAIDSEDNIACTTTEDDGSVEFYDLSTQSGFSELLPNSGANQFFSGADVEYDPIHKLFLVAQPNSSSASSGSTIYVYDINGVLVNTLNGFSFSNAFNVVSAHIGLNPAKRIGFVDGPSENVSSIQSFSY